MEKLTLLLVLVLFACNNDTDTVTPNIEFEDPTKVEMLGYSGNIMEPFISKDGNILLFNNLNAAPENTNLHWATKANETTFQYQGEIAGVNTPDLEGVPTMDNSNHLYFVSLRSYANTLSSVYKCDFLNGVAINIEIVNGISKLEVGWLNFDIEVSADGENVFFADAEFDGSDIPKTSDLVIAKKNSTGFERLPNSNEILKNINTNALEYAACISDDQLELYFTRLTLPITAASPPEILISTRQNINEPFGKPSKIESIEGFVEAPTITPDQKTIYYHKKENNIHVLYMVSKK